MTNGRTATRMGWTAAWCLCLAASGFSATLDFETVPVGTVYGDTPLKPDSPTEVVLTQNDITMSVETYFFDPLQSDFYEAEVVAVQTDAGPGHALSLDNIGVLFDFSLLGFDVERVTLDVRDLGGTSNVAVNGAALHILDPLSDLPAEVAPGVTALLADDRLTLVGETTALLSLQIGGQEIIIDDIRAVPEPAVGAFMTWGMIWLLGRRRKQ
jgi:hypothetical protein